MVDDGAHGPCRSNARANPTQVESTELLPPCLRTMYRQSAVRELPRRDLHETESPPWCGARAAVASLPDCGHGPGRSRSGLAPPFSFSRAYAAARRAAWRLKRTAYPLALPRDGHTPCERRPPFFPPLVDSGPAGGATYRSTIDQHACLWLGRQSHVSGA